MNKKILGIIAAVVVVGAGFWYLTKPTGNNTTSTQNPTNHTQGKGTTGVTLVEYGDFQCPACHDYYPLVKQIQQDFGDQIVFQFRNYPLESKHKNARAGARAAEAADMQGKYWEMHDQLYENQPYWQDATDPLSFYKGYAKNIGITDMAKFEADYRSSTVNGLINADLEEGKKVPVDGTPTFVLDGKKVVDNPTTMNAFNKLIQDEIDKKKPAASTNSGSSDTASTAPAQ